MPTPLTLSQKNWLVFLIGFTLLTIAWIIDNLWCDNNYFNKIKYRPDCSYQVPEGYSIYYSKIRKKYAVQVHRYGSTDYYLTDGGFMIIVRLSEVQSPTKFDDSCEAKAYLKAYLKSNYTKFE